MDASELLTSNVIHLARLEVFADGSECWNKIIYVHKDTVIALVNLIRQAMQSAVDEQANHASVGMIIFAGSIRVEKAEAHAWIAIAFLKIHDLDFVHPLGCGVIIVLYDRM